MLALIDVEKTHTSLDLSPKGSLEDKYLFKFSAQKNYFLWYNQKKSLYTLFNP